MTLPRRTATPRPSARRVAAAFTLVEVLMGVLILALGLLGLAAVIPMVVREQRIATDVTLGVIAGEDAQAYLEQHERLNRLHTADGEISGWGDWLLPPPPPMGNGDWSEDFLWERWDHPSTEVAPDTGDMTLFDETHAPDVVITVADRLWPPRSVDRAEPQFVWDIVGRRLPPRRASTPSMDGVGEPWRLQIALFVRRIDQGIRVPRGHTLFDVLTGANGLDPADRRVPVGVDDDGRPTRNGTGVYAAPIFADAIARESRPGSGVYDRLELDGLTENGERLAGQPGQKLVDNLGQVYTVQRVDEADSSGRTVVIEPPVPAWVVDNDDDAYRLREVMFTPQVPAAVRVFTLTPVDPS